MKNAEKINAVLKAIVESEGSEGDKSLQEFLNGEGMSFEIKQDRFASLMTFVCQLVAKDRELALLFQENVRKFQKLEALEKLMEKLKDPSKVIEGV